jgi:3-oxoacyl-[acyl-carrier protein] reductase
MNLLSLKGKIAFISGSSRGIGWSTAQALAEQGATLILNCRSDADLLKKRVEQLKDSYNCQASFQVADFKDPKQIANCYREIFKSYGSIDIVVNNAGIMQPALLGMISDEIIQDSFDLNALGVIYSTQAAARIMMKKKSGSIINISSILGVEGHAGQVVYSATKSAVIGITKASAKELAPHHIRVNCVAPGFIDTDFTASQSKEIVASIKMGRIGTPKEVADAILFFASSLSEYVTGQILGVDGGLIV